GGRGEGAGVARDGEGPGRSRRARRADRHLRDEGWAAERRPCRSQSVGGPRVQAPAPRRRDGDARRSRLHRPPGRGHGRAGEHAQGSQHGRVHALFLLPVAGARSPAGLVQVGAVPVPRRPRSARRAARAWGRIARRRRGPRVGLDGRVALSRPARAAAGNGGPDRGSACSARHSRRDDRRGPGAESGRAMNGAHDLGGLHGFGPVVIEPDEPVFHAEWERRVFALRMAMDVRARWNIDVSRYSIEQMPPAEYLAASYYERWLWRLERLLEQHGFL